MSTTNDDEGHFINPWAFSTSKTEAMRELVAVALGNKEERGGIARDTGGERRERRIEKAMRKKARESALRDLALEERDGEGDNDSNSSSSSSNIIMPEMKGPLGDCGIRHKQREDCFEIVNVAGGVNSNDADVVINESDVFDAEFYFLDNDAIVDIRIAARDAPKGGSFALSFLTKA